MCGCRVFQYSSRQANAAVPLHNSIISGVDQIHEQLMCPVTVSLYSFAQLELNVDLGWLEVLPLLQMLRKQSEHIGFISKPDWVQVYQISQAFSPNRLMHKSDNRQRPFVHS